MSDLPEDLEPHRPGAREWYGVWPGTVVGVDDPMQRGRLRIRVDQVYGLRDDPREDQIPDDQLPWARPCFPVPGNGGDGVFHAPPVGAGVWVIFWQGDPEEPVWIGGFAGNGDVPARVTESYGPPGAGLQTRYIRTPGGQVLELRWKPGEEEIVLQAPVLPPTPTQPNPAAGATIRISHKSAAPAERQVEITTTAGHVFRMADLPVPQTTLSGPGGFTSTFVGAAALNYLAYALTAVTTLTLTATGAMTLTAAGISLLLTSGVLQLGQAGTFRRLIDERFAALFDAHTHGGVTPGAGVTGTPTTPLSPSIATFSTDNVRAN